jgi:chitodextrinase
VGRPLVTVSADVNTWRALVTVRRWISSTGSTKSARVVVIAAAVALLPTAAYAVSADDAERATVTLLSYGAPVSTSSVFAPTVTDGDRAVDGDVDTVWISQPHSRGQQWLTVDLGAPARIDRVGVAWGEDPATDYAVQTSAEGTEWHTIRDVHGDGAVDEHEGLAGQGRYVRLAIDGAAPDGFTLRELTVYGDRNGAGDTEPPTDPSGLAVAGTTTDHVTLTWSPARDDTAVTGYQVLRHGEVVATTRGTEFTDGPLVSGHAFDYAVRAVDAAGNVSNPSPAATATTAEENDAAATTIAVAGDIATDCTASDENCPHARTADLVESMNPAAVLTLGDNQYENGELEDYQSYYDTTWGRFLDKTYPTPGNHEYHSDAVGYKEYYGDRATPNGETYYSFDVGGWHFLALDSNLDIGSGSAQLDWLTADLANNTSACTAAYYHHPRFSSGEHGDDPVSQDVWAAFDAAGGDVIFAGHDHHYERFAPVTADGTADENGVRSAVIGTGGRSLYSIGDPHEFTEKLIGDQHGVAKLTVTETTYQWDFIGLDGEVLDSTPTVDCVTS